MPVNYTFYPENWKSEIKGNMDFFIPAKKTL